VGIFGSDQDEADADESNERMAPAATGLVEKLLHVGIEGAGRFDSAEKIASVATGEHPEPDRAIDAIVNSHLKLAAAGGFLTGIGGLVTMPVALPANVLEFYLVATRMVAAVASVRGYDIRRPEVRSAILLALVGAEADDLLQKLGFVPAGRLSSLAAERLPGPVMLAINKGVGFRLVSQVGKKALTRFGKAVPLVGGVVGAGLDTYLLHRIADHTKHEFPPKSRPLHR
jgi:hypothetical protein